ncbi:hypothetical protein BDW60DRAFT_204917 [Aspergillus nidulans var. acristatus]
MARSSNEKRGRRRQERREAPANHIYDRVKLRIAPSDIRLQPSQVKAIVHPGSELYVGSVPSALPAVDKKRPQRGPAPYHRHRCQMQAFL